MLPRTKLVTLIIFLTLSLFAIFLLVNSSLFNSKETKVSNNKVELAPLLKSGKKDEVLSELDTSDRRTYIIPVEIVKPFYINDIFIKADVFATGDQNKTVFSINLGPSTTKIYLGKEQGEKVVWGWVTAGDLLLENKKWEKTSIYVSFSKTDKNSLMHAESIYSFAQLLLEGKSHKILVREVPVLQLKQTTLNEK